MTTRNFKIFLVDDDAFHLNMAKHILNGLGQNDVSIFENGIDCLNDIHRQPDVVFLDHNMDHYTGYEVLRKIKRFNPNIFVVMVSSQEEISIAVDSLKHGAFDYLQKGLDMPEKIETTLNKITEFIEVMEEKKPSILKSIFKFL